MCVCVSLCHNTRLIKATTQSFFFYTSVEERKKRLFNGCYSITEGKKNTVSERGEEELYNGVHKRIYGAVEFQ